ncbi:chaperonin 10-like protein [Delphinella strobiligena]|nr:chaperonin 10-like protein [Delphinella strobiligena]
MPPEDSEMESLNGSYPLNPDLKETGIENPSLQVTADHQIKMVPAPILKPGPNEVLLHVKATGICGSDVHFWKRGAIRTLIVEGDCILGHEASGIVLECGEDVKNLRPGDRVAVEPGVPCDDCWLCKEGRYNLCEAVKFAGVYPHAGTLQRFKVHAARWLHKLPQNLSFAEGALLEPLSVVMHGIERAHLSLGRGAVICGAGPIGLIALAAARASGANPLCITDLEPSRLAFAKSYVPGCQTYLVDTSLDPMQNAREIRKIFGQGEYVAPPTVLECTGVESSVATAAYVVRRGGRVLVIGVGASSLKLPFMHMSLGEVDFAFINRYRDTWPAGISALSGGLLDLKPLVSHVFPLERAVDAMRLSADLSKGSIKVQIIDEMDLTAEQINTH